MDTFIPLKFFTYNWEKGLNPDLIITPPYDVYGQKQKEIFAQKSSYNFVHLDLPQSYLEAKNLLLKWIQNEILIQNPIPRFYLMKTNYKIGQKKLTRWGIFGGLKLFPLGEKNIFPHEKTYPKAKQDRLNLMETTSSQLSPIFGVYADKTLFLTHLGETIEEISPILTYKENEHIEHILWEIPEKYNQELQLFFQNQKFFIADGHHRYETALAYKQKKAKPGPWDYIFIYLSNITSPGVEILPYHRMLTWEEKFNFQKVIHSAQELFEVKDLTETGSNSIANNFDFILKQKTNQFGFTFKKPRTNYFYNLSTYLLDEFILKKELNLNEEKIKTGNYIKYTPFLEEIEEKLSQNKIQAAFLVNKVDPELFQSIALSNKLMPRKSTYFYPKVPSGLLFYSWI
ncbi:DUF1015 family protein [Desulfonauticus submarinus]